jgi:RAB protein geranylgeranyltransferase component A
LLDKYDKIRNRIDSLRATLLKPEAEHASDEEFIYQLSGERKRSRIQVAVDELESLSHEIEGYSTFVEGLPFQAIKFADDDARLLT